MRFDVRLTRHQMTIERCRRDELSEPRDCPVWFDPRERGALRCVNREYLLGKPRRGACR